MIGPSRLSKQQKIVGPGLVKGPWFLVRYKIAASESNMRYCAMDDFTAQIKADGGSWSETEVLGNMALVKVNASAATLARLSLVFTPLPLSQLTDVFSGVPVATRDAFKGKCLEMGYTQAEVDSNLGDLSTRSLSQFLNFAATRRLKPRYDVGTGAIILDGPVQWVKPISVVDQEVA